MDIKNQPDPVQAAEKSLPEAKTYPRSVAPYSAPAGMSDEEHSKAIGGARTRTVYRDEPAETVKKSTLKNDYR